MRDSFVFYRGFFESFSELSKKDRLVLFDALCEYALNDVEPELSGVTSAVFKMLKPQVDANIRRYENGKRGGRPRKNQTETKAEPNENQTKTKTEPNDNVNVNVNVNDNVNVNVNDNYNDNYNNVNGLGSSVGRGGSGDDNVFDIWKRLNPDDIDAIHDVYPESGSDLIQEVYEEVKAKRRKIENPVAYILGYAKNVNWDDKADHVGEVLT